jgi:hypothetical protein
MQVVVSDTIQRLYFLVKRYEIPKRIIELHIAILNPVCYTLPIPKKEAYQDER